MKSPGETLDSILQRYLRGYPESVQRQACRLVRERRLVDYLADRYPDRHAIRSDAALYDYVQDLKQTRMRSSPPLHKAVWQNKMDVLRNVLGLNTAVSRVQGGRLKAKSEIRIASLFKDAAPQFLEMIVVHELAHLRQRDHDKAFYQLCRHMLPDYDQVEFDLRLLLLANSLADNTDRFPGSR